MEIFAGRYHLVDPIADGGMGSVWRAWDAKRGGYVAAKLLRPSDAASLLRFVREQALRVSHPNVVAPHGWAAEDELVLLTMDLVGGGSAHQLIGDYGAIPVPYAAVLVDQLWSALTEVHAHGIVHRDVKPANLLLEVTGRAAPVLRLADFGIAAVTGQPRLTEASVIVGTPGYLAPEALLDTQPHPTHDVYATGVVAWRLLTGLTPPPEGPAVDPQHPPTNVPAPVWRAVATFTEPDPQQRPSSAADAWRAWREALSAAAVPAVDANRPDAVEVFDQLGPLPDGFAPSGPVRLAPAPPLSPAFGGAQAGAGEAEGVPPSSGAGAGAQPSPGSGAGAEGAPPGSGAGAVSSASGQGQAATGRPTQAVRPSSGAGAGPQLPPTKSMRASGGRRVVLGIALGLAALGAVILAVSLVLLLA
ncbi:serine/threonine-protein kinase [Stackebrandtia nassauensis]|uniref:non-specific serine/threonine protein kinase n=1 Tax=Stackebrandtia nassauensis (strain DSM 44728 / CIP 108903 / NRRL B-16338 / NBRC 102104 / LLR-40K-21) TaxID=446470 RepID=D3PYC4_STANL|nr:serine/threonine-protein kinase [Stackebrandtia nassauensis]ADD41491.1 serine/threonine protein kinase [Stackebrandtia nassauensis DSM 44728]